MSSKLKMQVFLPTLHDEKAAEVARRMPFLKKEFKVGVTCLSSDEPGEGAFADSGITLTGLDVDPIPPDDPYNFMKVMTQQLQDDLPKIAMASLPSPAGAAFLIAAKASGVPLVVAEIDDQPSLLSSFEELSALYFSDLLLPASRNLQRVITQTLPQIAERVGNLLPHSADTTYIQLTKEDRHRLRKDLRVDTDLKMVTMIAPFDRRRDHDTLLDACALLKQRGQKFVLMLVGEGPERRRIAEKIYALRLEDQVSIMDDPGDHIDILCATDIFALSTHFEDNSTPLIEAMAQGLAIAATDVPGINDLLRNGRSGRLAKARDAESFASALKDLLAQEKIRKKLGSVARKCIENRSNLTQFMPQFIGTLRKKLKDSTDKKNKQISEPNNSQSATRYLELQESVRNLNSIDDPQSGIAQVGDLMDGFPVNVQVDILEKLCTVPITTGPLTMFVRPLEKVLSDGFFEHMPLLEMRLFQRLCVFYMDLEYAEGAEKLIENMEENVKKALFRYHFSCNRFSGIRAHVRLAQLYQFASKKDLRDHYRLELWEYLKSGTESTDSVFHHQNAYVLESLGEAKLAKREMQLTGMDTIQIGASVPIAQGLKEKPKRRGRKKSTDLVVIPDSQDEQLLETEA
ncbi:hypothetical protein CEE37_01140 [candidate division LCP-89 bacterium B3_LCP]|uniref:Glycosyl transferase family 1 domain-containing protein n=1 Tax=candidate division LCP-89 bacterium B3_LCP TaxID=2012998 RepID=A0A532V533_UNCL8|nr:MAG: hypothetical protein CEE37_01140 [candidate division LCP-89 bacterium B3_LCP]